MDQESSGIPDSPRQEPGGQVVIGFDPGRDKCGIAVVQVQPHWQVLQRQVRDAATALATLHSLWRQFHAEKLILGNQTTASLWKQKLETIIPPPAIVLVDERYSSQEARQRYWDFYPAQGWMRLVPKGLRVPTHAYDDLVALILVERYCRGSATAKPA